MFICNACLQKSFTNPPSIHTSLGSCEICNIRAICNDIRSGLLVHKKKSGNLKSTKK